MREEPNIARETIRACLTEGYGLEPSSIEFLPLGLDMNAGVYRIAGPRGQNLLKVKAVPPYAASCLVPRYLYDRGVESVVAPIPNREGRLWSRLGEWSFIVYPFVEGESGWANMTDAHWRTTGAIFRRIHRVPAPADIDGLRSETFKPSLYRDQVRAIDGRIDEPAAAMSEPERALRALWEKHGRTIHALPESMGRLASVLATRPNRFVICHADLHPGNLLRRASGEVFVIDWDDVILAPRERDFIFVGEPAEDSSQAAGSPFFDGYGSDEIDWVALTYYRYERVITDIIAYAEEVLIREDLSEQTKSRSAWAVGESLEGRNFKAAQAAASHVPSELAIYPNVLR